jgi:hypothetical protein
MNNEKYENFVSYFCSLVFFLYICVVNK